MKSDIDKLSTTRVKMTVEVPFEEMAEDIAAAYKNIAGQVSVPGFRKGKVPARVIDQRFGRGTVLSDVVNAVIPRLYEQIVTDEEIVPLGQPDVEVTKIEDGDLIEFTAEVDIRPEFDLPDYESISVQVDLPKTDDEVVAEQLENLQNRFASFNPVERAAADGDVLLVDVIATHEGDEVEEYSSQGLSYQLGSGGAVDGFDEAITGAEAGETREFEYIPAEGDHAGKSITMSVTVSAVRERVLPELDDDFAVMASEFDTLDELRNDLTERLGKVGLMQQTQEAREKVHEALLELVDVDLPEGLIQSQLDEHFADGHGDDDHRAEHEQELRSNLKSQFVLDRIAEEVGIEVEEAELTQWLFQQAQRYGMQPDQFANALVEGGQVPAAIADVRRGKALGLVVEKATVTDTDGNVLDLEEIRQSVLGGPAKATEAPVEDVEDVVLEAEESDSEDSQTDSTAEEPAQA